MYNLEIDHLMYLDILFPNDYSTYNSLQLFSLQKITQQWKALGLGLLKEASDRLCGDTKNCKQYWILEAKNKLAKSTTSLNYSSCS